MDRRPSYIQASASCATPASEQTCETTKTGVVVPIFAEDRGDLLGEAFAHLLELDEISLRRVVSALRRGILPGSEAV